MMIFALVQCYQSKTCALAFMLFWHVWVALCIYSLCTLCGHLYPRHLPHWKLNFFLAVNLQSRQRLTCRFCPGSWPDSWSQLGPIIALCLALLTMVCIDSEPGFALSTTWHCTERVIDAVNDSLLLLASIADFCGVPIEQPVFLCSNSSLYTFTEPQQTARTLTVMLANCSWWWFYCVL